MTKSLRQPSVMSHDFSRIPSTDMERSTFNRDHGYKTTMDSGYLIPIFVDEALPGDTFSVKLSAVSRLATPIVPFMDNLHMDFFFFAVPNRLLWENWQRFMGEKDNPDDSTDYLVPKVTAPAGGWPIGSIADYFGIPTGVEYDSVNALHFRAYNLCWAEWFRDENLQDSPIINKGDGPDPDTDYTILRRGKRRDYFTSCLPWPQKGDAVDLPIGSQAPVIGIGKNTQTFNPASLSYYETGGSGPVAYSPYATINDVQPDNAWGVQEDPSNPGFPAIYADLSNATAATINSLREAFQLQRMLERDARGGTRYTEILRSHFKTVSPDARLQRPEYLGGGSTPIMITPIAQTTATDIVPDVTPQGNLAAIGYTSTSGISWTKSFVEHSTLIGMCAIRADLTYQTGLSRMWSRQTRYDFYWPALAHLGEQEVRNKEIYLQGLEDDEGIFGYQERWAEYRYKPSLITGKMRSVDPQSLDYWHLAQDFSTLPVLNDAFIQDVPPVERVVAVTDEPQFVTDLFFKCKTTRPMPMYSVPGLIDHF